MAQTVDEIYNSIAQNILDNTPNGWTEAVIDVERDADDAIELGGGYKTDTDDFVSFKFRNFDRRIIKDFHELHAITTEGGSNPWNRAKFTLEPSGKFSIDFEWDQKLEDEIKANS